MLEKMYNYVNPVVSLDPSLAHHGQCSLLGQKVLLGHQFQTMKNCRRSGFFYVEDHDTYKGLGEYRNNMYSYN